MITLKTIMTLVQAIEFRNAGFLKESRDILENLLTEAPEDAMLHYHLGVTIGRLGEHRAAIASYRHALELGLPDENEAQALLAIATTFRAMGRYFEAARELRRGLLRRPGDDALRALLALCLNKLGMYDDALHIAMQLLLSTTNSRSLLEHSSLLSIYMEELVDQEDAASA